MSTSNRFDFTLVVGVDEQHLRELNIVWPTWKKHKPSTILSNPMIVFYDYRQVDPSSIRRIVDHPRLRTIAWPINGFLEPNPSEGKTKDKFNDPQRETMLNGFVYVPAAYVNTRYWLKLDTDVVATGMDDWIDPEWFEGDPVIVSHRWFFTRPADQMLQMDKWVEENIDRMPPEIANAPPLNLIPEPGKDRVNHQRIISWCAFFDTVWTRQMALLTEVRTGYYRLPVASQDGFLWYMAKRGGRKIVRVNMKARGFSHWLTFDNIVKHAQEAMNQ